jgi:hypothetical protein
MRRSRLPRVRRIAARWRCPSVHLLLGDRDRLRRAGRVASDSPGGVAERLNAAVLKTVVRLSAYREFESLPLRFECAEDGKSAIVHVYSGSSTLGSPVRTVEVAIAGSAWSAGPVAALADCVYTARAEQQDSDFYGQTGVSAPVTFTVDADTPVRADRGRTHAYRAVLDVTLLPIRATKPR